VLPVSSLPVAVCYLLVHTLTVLSVGVCREQ
jgi:hypothetical protein